MRHWAAILAMGVAVAASVVAQNAGNGGESTTTPKPSIVPVSWELKFESQAPQPISVLLPGQSKLRTYWYMLYKVTNQTGQDRMFVPDFVLYADTGKTVHGGDNVPSTVFLAIQKRHNDPLLTDHANMIGKLLQGEDNVRHGVAIWTDIDPEARAFDLFTGGLSGETVKVKLPTPVTVVEVNDEGKKVEVTKTEAVLGKTLQIRYSMPSEAAARFRVMPKEISRQWVMR